MVLGSSYLSARKILVLGTSTTFCPQVTVKAHVYSWSATTWQGGHVGGQYNRIVLEEFTWKWSLVSSGEKCFCNYTMAAVTLRANQQFVTFKKRREIFTRFVHPVCRKTRSTSMIQCAFRQRNHRKAWALPQCSSINEICSFIRIEIKIRVYAKRQTWICTTWPSFPLIFRLLLYCFYKKISSFMPVWTIGIVSGLF